MIFTFWKEDDPYIYVENIAEVCYSIAKNIKDEGFEPGRATEEICFDLLLQSELTAKTIETLIFLFLGGREEHDDVGEERASYMSAVYACVAEALADDEPINTLRVY